MPRSFSYILKVYGKKFWSSRAEASAPPGVGKNLMVETGFFNDSSDASADDQKGPSCESH